MRALKLNEIEIEEFFGMEPRTEEEAGFSVSGLHWGY